MKRATFTAAEVTRYAKVAAQAGVAVTLEGPDGRRVTIAPVAEPDQQAISSDTPDSVLQAWLSRNGDRVERPA